MGPDVPSQAGGTLAWGSLAQTRSQQGQRHRCSRSLASMSKSVRASPGMGIPYLLHRDRLFPWGRMGFPVLQLCWWFWGPRCAPPSRDWPQHLWDPFGQEKKLLDLCLLVSSWVSPASPASPCMPWPTPTTAKVSPGLLCFGDPLEPQTDPSTQMGSPQCGAEGRGPPFNLPSTLCRVEKQDDASRSSSRHLIWKPRKTCLEWNCAQVRGCPPVLGHWAPDHVTSMASKEQEQNDIWRLLVKLLCGILLSPEMLRSHSDSSPSCSVPQSDPGGFFWLHPVFILHLTWFGELQFPNGLGILSSCGAGTQGGHRFLSQTGFSQFSL